MAYSITCCESTSFCLHCLVWWVCRDMNNIFFPGNCIFLVDSCMSTKTCLQLFEVLSFWFIVFPGTEQHSFSYFTVTATSVIELSVSPQLSHVGAESHSVSVKSSRVSTESSRDTTNVKTSSDWWTRYPHSTPATFIPGKLNTL